MSDKNECEKCGGYNHWINNSCTICDLQKEISILKKEKAVLLEAVEVNANCDHSKGCSICQHLAEIALEKLKEIRE